MATKYTRKHLHTSVQKQWGMIYTSVGHVYKTFMPFILMYHGTNFLHKEATTAHFLVLTVTNIKLYFKCIVQYSICCIVL